MLEKTKDFNRAKRLFDEAKFYHLNDARAQRNFKAKVRRLAKKYCPMEIEPGRDEGQIIMYLDHIAFRLDMELQFKERK